MGDVFWDTLYCFRCRLGQHYVCLSVHHRDVG